MTKIKVPIKIYLCGHSRECAVGTSECLPALNGFLAPTGLYAMCSHSRRHVCVAPGRWRRCVWLESAGYKERGRCRCKEDK